MLTVCIDHMYIIAGFKKKTSPNYLSNKQAKTYLPCKKEKLRKNIVVNK